MRHFQAGNGCRQASAASAPIQTVPAPGTAPRPAQAPPEWPSSQVRVLRAISRDALDQEGTVFLILLGHGGASNPPSVLCSKPRNGMTRTKLANFGISSRERQRSGAATSAGCCGCRPGEIGARKGEGSGPVRSVTNLYQGSRK